MEQSPIQRLELLREIAETINEAYEMEPMLDSVLQKLLALTGLKTGWIFLLKPGDRHYKFAAENQLPYALQVTDRKPMKSGSCWCIDRFRDGRLHHAVNILNCKRIEDAIRLRRGDTDGITHHASIPLRAGEELFGILNVASPGKTRFTDEELALLQSIAYQIGTASHRIQLFRMERKRADLLSRLGTVARHLGSTRAKESLDAEIVRLAGEQMAWPSLALYVQRSSESFFRTSYAEGKIDARGETDINAQEDRIIRTLADQRPALWRDVPTREERGRGMWRSGCAAPVQMNGKNWGFLVAGSTEPDGMDEIDLEALEALASHVALAFETISLNEKSHELTRWEERNRIARDLHDSVSQMLFSLSLNAKGLSQALPDVTEATKEALGRIQRLSQSAIGEMRAMIRQLRPAGLEEGLLTGLQRYGEQIGLRVKLRSGDPTELSERLQNVFWRIGQEALNNVSKHAGTAEASILLSYTEWEACLTISDNGPGIESDSSTGSNKFGMATMRERAESVGGSVTVKSNAANGTRVVVRLPI
ncbi:GAF domain-containing protein [Cohnella endophytica]|uniref:Oxygen sensor histidine kinase NreB n=1 Tax=Cohnella endophytica TaxID=2419778 RepID=A0A494Y3N7_9BACL|nr:GAF domain-containing sensor histidine kinase [Cohnella endophytica]RKP57366.1 GAF domain-containing protein [Cohnella endophytica]